MSLYVPDDTVMHGWLTFNGPRRVLSKDKANDYTYTNKEEP